MIKFIFYWRVSTEDRQDPEASRAWQLARARALIEGHGAIVAEERDTNCSRSLPWDYRQGAARILEQARSGTRTWDAVVVGEHTRAFFGNQFAETVPKLNHYGVKIWIPELGGPADPQSVAHEMMMLINGSVSKNERAAMRIRVRDAMASQIGDGLRQFMGGRPPYGYRLGDAGPHPNPGKAADGKRLHFLEPDPDTAPVVARIFAMYVSGISARAIAQTLTDEDIPCPSAQDRERNKGRHGLAWSYSAVRAILKNEVYRGVTLQGRTRKVEVLRDPENPSKGYVTRREAVPESEWTRSPHPTHEALIDEETWTTVVRRFQTTKDTGATTNRRAPRRPKDATRTYLLSGHIACGICGHRLQGQENHGRTYYRCRHRDTYAVSPAHPKNVYVPEEGVLPGLHSWLADLCDPGRLDDTVAACMAAIADHDPTIEDRRRLDAIIRKADAEMANLIEVIKAGGDAKVLADQVNAVRQRRDLAEANLAALDRPHITPPTEDEVRQILTETLDLVLDEADPVAFRDMVRAIDLHLVYDPTSKTIKGRCHLSATGPWGNGRVGGGT